MKDRPRCDVESLLLWAHHFYFINDSFKIYLGPLKDRYIKHGRRWANFLPHTNTRRLLRIRKLTVKTISRPAYWLRQICIKWTKTTREKSVKWNGHTQSNTLNDTTNDGGEKKNAEQLSGLLDAEWKQLPMSSKKKVKRPLAARAKVAPSMIPNENHDLLLIWDQRVFYLVFLFFW